MCFLLFICWLSFLQLSVRIFQRVQCSVPLVMSVRRKLALHVIADLRE